MATRYKYLDTVVIYGLTLSFAASPQLSHAGPPIKLEQGVTSAPSQKHMLEFEATVIYKDVEKGFYALHADNGKRFLPMNLPVTMRVHGTRIKVKGTIRQNIASLTNYGEIFEIDSALLLSKGKGHNLR